MQSFDHVILGTGQATGTLLGGLLPTGESIAVIEARRIGGTCVNTGCTPTKTLVASARVAQMVRRAPEYGIHPGSIDIHFDEVMARMNKVRGDSRSGLENYITSQEQVTLFREKGHFESNNTLRVGNEVVLGRNIYINVGTRPNIPQIVGIDWVPWVHNEGILEVTELPRQLINIGGGYIALEFSQIFRRFGAEVTVLERGNHLMKKEDADVAEAVREILENEGIQIHLNASPRELKPSRNNGVSVSVQAQSGDFTVEGSHLLFATGRLPNSDTLNLEATDIQVDGRGYIQVDDHCRTAVDNVFALGDVNGKGAFTHTSVNDAEIVLDLRRGGSRKLSDRIPTYALFIDPPLGRVGLTEKEAVAQGYTVLKATREMARISRAKEMGEIQGFAKLLVDAETDLILGGSILGPGGDEIINMFAAYMYSGLPCKQYRKSVLIHPTVSELMPWVLDSLEPVNG